MSKSDFVKQFDKLREEAQERWDKMTDEEKAKMKERSRRFAQKSRSVVPTVPQSTSSK